MSLPVKLPVHLRAASDRPVSDDVSAASPAAATAHAAPERTRDGRTVYAPFAEEKVPAGTLHLWRALRQVMDPELPISVVDMGLVYDILLHDGRVTVDLTFTALGCPCMAFIKQDVEERLREEPSVDEVEVREVWDPAWTVGRMTERGRKELRALGVAA